MNYTTKLGATVIEIPVVTAVHPDRHGWRFTDSGQYLVTPDGQHLNCCSLLRESGGFKSPEAEALDSRLRGRGRKMWTTASPSAARW